LLLRPPIHRFRTHSGCAAACAVLISTAAFALAGCASSGDATTPTAATSKLSDVFATPDWAKFTGADRSKTAVRAITPDDLIGADGSCAATRVAAPATEPPPQPLPSPTPEAQQMPQTDGASSRDSAQPSMAPGAQPGPTVSGGIALAMTECDVAQRAGFPGNVEIGSEAGGERSVVLTYRQGPWPGIYRFRGGRLVSIERVEVVEPPKPKKPAKPTRPPTKVRVGPSG
jgi:hypothetical protein